MPDMNKVLFIRAKRCDECDPADICDSCLQGFYSFGHAKDNASSQGWNIIDASDENANKSYVNNVIDTEDPGVIFGFGHGLETIFSAQHREYIFTTSDCEKVNGRMVFLLSCLTAGALGPMMMEKGALAYAGYNISWTWIADTDVNNNFKYPDPKHDKYANGFFESATEVIHSISNGNTFIEAVHASIQKYNDWIQYWYDTGGSDATECIMWLAYDRDGLVAMTGCEGVQVESDCISAGCVWNNNVCSTLPTKKVMTDAAMLIPVILIVGMAFIAFKK